MGQQENQAIFMQFMEAAEKGDLEAMAALVDDDFVMEWPQSGERFVGKANALAAMQAQPDKPEPAGEPRMLAGDDFFVLAMPLRYESGISHYVGIFEIAEGRLRKSTEYFAAPMPAQAFRAQYAEPQAGAGRLTPAARAGTARPPRWALAQAH